MKTFHAEPNLRVGYTTETPTPVLDANGEETYELNEDGEQVAVVIAPQVHGLPLLSHANTKVLRHVLEVQEYISDNPQPELEDFENETKANIARTKWMLDVIPVVAHCIAECTVGKTADEDVLNEKPLEWVMGLFQHWTNNGVEEDELPKS